MTIKTMKGLLVVSLLGMGLLAGCSGSSESSGAAGAGSPGGENALAEATGVVGAAGGRVVLPQYATLRMSPGSTDESTVTLEALTSPTMDNLAPHLAPGFEFLPNVPKFRIRLTKKPTRIIHLSIAVPNLVQMLPATQDLVFAVLRLEAESDEEVPHHTLTSVAGEVCEERTAVCLFLLPGWFNDESEAGDFQIQLGIGRAPVDLRPVTLSWWDRLFEETMAFAAETRWHLWTVKNASPTGDEVSPDSSNRLHVGGSIALESNLPFLSPPVHEALAIESDFGARAVSGNTSASKYHEAVDLRAAEGTDVYSMLPGGTVTFAGAGEDRARCRSGSATILSDPLKRVDKRYGPMNALEIRYLHLKEVIGGGVSELIAKSGKTGTCSFHLHIDMTFRDEFDVPAKIDPWPVIANDVTRFVANDGDPVLATCQGCRELFDFFYVLHVSDGTYLKPGIAEAFGGTLAPDYDWPKGSISHTLTAQQGTFDLSGFPREVTNGKYVLRLSLCSESIGGCRKVRDWKIVPVEPTCPDNFPDISAYVFDGYQEKTQVAPSISVSTSSSLNGVTSLAQGTKGNVTVSVSALGQNPPRARVHYKDSFIVTSSGKSGQGTATITPQGSATVSLACTEQDISNLRQSGGSAYAQIGDPFPYANIWDGKNCAGVANPTGIDQAMSTLRFFYGVAVEFQVHVEAITQHLFTQPGTTASAAASLTGYNVTVLNDPDAKVTFCRAAAPAP